MYSRMKIDVGEMPQSVHLGLQTLTHFTVCVGGGGRSDYGVLVWCVYGVGGGVILVVGVWCVCGV